MAGRSHAVLGPCGGVGPFVSVPRQRCRGGLCTPPGCGVRSRGAQPPLNQRHFPAHHERGLCAPASGASTTVAVLRSPLPVSRRGDDVRSLALAVLDALGGAAASILVAKRGLSPATPFGFVPGRAGPGRYPGSHAGVGCAHHHRGCAPAIRKSRPPRTNPKPVYPALPFAFHRSAYALG